MIQSNLRSRTLRGLRRARADARLSSVQGTPYDTMYIPFLQSSRTLMRLAVRTAGPPDRLAAPVRDLLRETDLEIPLAGPAAMADIVEEDLAGYRVITRSLGLFALIALLLTGIRLYSILVNHVSVFLYLPTGERAEQIACYPATSMIHGEMISLGLLYLGQLPALPISPAWIAYTHTVVDRELDSEPPVYLIHLLDSESGETRTLRRHYRPVPVEWEPSGTSEELRQRNPSQYRAMEAVNAKASSYFREHPWQGGPAGSAPRRRLPVRLHVCP